ncbi:thymidylate synthase family protein [Rhodococcus sp. MTM3W5.2]|uniref:hypothetical protein n=1 Tax=Rhodococcus sp. MTM3W5.2 TaxID=1805827 RepID=UPI0009790787|nr:hypothetical protein [Rhodococcus sp. MTM3W5.2]AQA21450.1 thymidylate synthase family protein [Rhodococcus sp. MTM3W5.2]
MATKVDDGLVVADSVSEGWLGAVQAVHEQSDHKMLQLITRIRAPHVEVPAIRREIDSFLEALGRDPVETVANTIFPQQLAQASGDIGALVTRYRRMYPTITKLSNDNRRGTYFGRLVAHPGRKTPVDQLGQLAAKIQTERAKTGPMKARYELSVAGPSDAGTDHGSVDVYDPDSDSKALMGFPCLSFCSFQLDGDSLHLVAHYRSQYLIQRGYGNYLGLARLQAYLAQQTGTQPGQLTVVAGLATLDEGKRKITDFLRRFESGLW